MPTPGGPQEHDVLPPLEEAERVQALELLALHTQLEAEVEVAERLDRRQPGAPHGGLEPAGIPERDVRAQELLQRLAGGELPAVDLTQDVVEGLQRPGHLEIGELRAEAVAE